MVAIKDVANIPLLAKASAGLDRSIVLANKVPVKYWRMALMAVALFWICHTLANLFWLVMPSPDLPVPTVTPTAVAVQSSGPSKVVDIEAVIALNLLGDFNAPPASDQPTDIITDAPVKITELNLQLQGIIASSDPKLSWAIIGPEADQKLYKIGDEVDGARGVKIVEIHDIKVRLNNNGNLEELWLYGEDGMKVASSSPGYSSPMDSPPPDQGQKATVSRDQIEQARNIGDVVRFMVATENGKMIGYKVRPGRKRELFDQVGLKTDDIVVSVNGIEVNEPQKVREVYQALKSATEANLQVMRDGTTHSIQITMSSEG